MKLFERKDSPAKGRHLVATQRIQKGQLLFVERPLLCLQSVGNSTLGALNCRHCRAFIGGPDICLAVASGRVSREDVWDYYQKRTESSADKGGKDRASCIDPSCYNMVCCRNQCGELYCSKECEEDTWFGDGHELMCTGLLPDPEESEEAEDFDENYEDTNETLHPLLQFKVHAVQSNEIFLMVADLVASVVSSRRKQIESQQLYAHEVKSYGSLDEIMAPYLDFTLKPWWEVVTDPMLSDVTKLNELIHLNKTLRELCETSSMLLKNAFLAKVKELKSSEKSSDKIFCSTLEQAIDECIKKFDIFSESFFGKIIGSFEQNSMGIRARHPLCREIIENDDFRIRGHSDILKCLNLAGMIGDEEQEKSDHETIEEQETEELGDNIYDDNSNEVDTSSSEEQYTCDEVADFIANLQIDEEGYNVSKKQNDDTSNANNDEEDSYGDDENDGDDLDIIFTPLDGTAMYATTCKMNHSCAPNVMVRYTFSCSGGGTFTRWGQNFPLVVSCNAIKGIEKGEELCISYINTDLTYSERSNELENYGFNCECHKCCEERISVSTSNLSAEVQEKNFSDEDNDLFGTDDASDGEQSENTSEPRESGLAQLVMKLNKTFSNSSRTSIPINIIAPTLSFVLQVGSSSLKRLDDNNFKQDDISNISMTDQLKIVLTSLSDHDFITALETAIIGERTAVKMLYKNQEWPSVSHREAHRCFTLTAAIGHAKNGNFLPALIAVDKAIIFGLERQTVATFLEYIEYHYSNLTPKVVMSAFIPDYSQQSLQNLVLKETAPIQYPISEVINEDIVETMKQSFSFRESVVIRDYAASWPALQTWRQLHFFDKEYGWRLIPLEKGAMTVKSGLREELTTFRSFGRNYLIPSSSKLVWPLSECNSQESEVAYLAQHPIFEQMPKLLKDISMPFINGGERPTNVNVWIGTGGTRTPCHYDSYDNVFVQIVGVKYVRCYDPSQTKNLHVIGKNVNTSFVKQGNISAINCEIEDFKVHHMAKNARYKGKDITKIYTDLILPPRRSSSAG